MIDDLNASNVFYKKRIEELGQRLQEQNELIITQRQQIKEFTSKPLNSVSEPKGKWTRIPVLEVRRASLTVHRTSEECGAPGGFRARTWHSCGDFNLSDLSP